MLSVPCAARLGVNAPWRSNDCFWTRLTPAFKLWTSMCACQNLYGIELPNRLLWDAFVVDRDISRQPDNVDLSTTASIRTSVSGRELHCPSKKK